MSDVPPSPGKTPRSGAPDPVRERAPGADELADDELAAEIELYTDVVLAASESDGPIRTGELDRVLGVEERAHGS